MVFSFFILICCTFCSTVVLDFVFVFRFITHYQSLINVISQVTDAILVTTIVIAQETNRANLAPMTVKNANLTIMDRYLD